LYRQGEAYFELREYKKAIECFEKAKSAPKPEPRAQHSLDLSVEAAKGGLFFRQILSGRDVCLHGQNIVQMQVFKFGAQMQNFVRLFVLILF
jgi:hypothetical protein